MKKIALLTLTLASMAALTSCSLFSSKKKVSAADFNKVLAKIEVYYYNTAVVKYTEKVTGTGYYKDKTKTTSATIEYTNYDGVWYTTSTDSCAESMGEMLYSIRGRTYPEINNSKQTVTYYTNPLTIVNKTNQTAVGITVTTDETDTFNKYGYITKISYKGVETVSKNYYPDSAGKITDTMNISVSYK